MDALIELYDSDLLKIEKVWEALNLKQMTQVDLERYRQEVIERFAEAGFQVDVVMMVVEEPGPIPVGTYVPEISILDRIEPEREFDIDRMVHEVQHDLLEIDPNPGVVQLDGTVRSPAQVTSFNKK